MQNFVFQNRTKIIFGKNTEYQIGAETAQYGKRALLHYGRGSIKKSGLYSRIVDSLKKEGIEVVELGGVVPNPRLSLVREGIELCRKEDIEIILAVGGGSVIDSAKAIAVGAKTDRDIWDYYTRKAEVEDALPVGTALTLPAAGSESSTGSVITNDENNHKSDCGSELLRPVFSILNPELTFTLPPFQTACGATDMLAHVMERYFTQEPDIELSDNMSEGVMRTIIRNAPIALAKPNDYASRAEIMWAGTIAHNDLLGRGRVEEWTSHFIEHELSGQYDVAHGAGLAVVFPAWMQYVYKTYLPRFVRFAIKVWNVDYHPGNPEKTALEGIQCLKNWLKSINMPINLNELGVPDNRYQLMADGAVRYGNIGHFKPLTSKDIVKIFQLME
ncbi:MAG: iron-containing alcohol dehydrogenase [Spirochaetes bacterium]|nr:iron-containing alcohol dehydrogenase [Spirochaetota bacterium]